MKKLIQSLNWAYEILLTMIMIISVTSGIMQVTVDTVYADESTVEVTDEKEYLKADELPYDTDYVLVIDKSGSLWVQEYNGEVGVLQKIRNSATQAFLRVAAGTNNRVAVVYFDKDAQEELGQGLTSVKSKADSDEILGKLNHYVLPKTENNKDGIEITEANASTNIAAGLECACNILETQGSPERKKCIILFSDGFNDLKSDSNEKKETFRKKTKDAIFGTEIEGTSGERRDDGLTTRIRKNKYELYCVYLENPESQEQELQSKKTLKDLVNACRANGELDKIKKFYYVSIDPDDEDEDVDLAKKFFNLAKQFSDVFYVSQNNSRHQDLVMMKDKEMQRSQFNVPYAAVSQLNLFLVNVPAGSHPVLRNTLTGQEYDDFVRDANEPEMGYYNISDPAPGDYELIIPGATDARGVFAFYTDLKAVIDIEKTNGFGLFPIGQYSRVKVKCGFYDAQGRLYNYEHFKPTVSLSRGDGEPDKPLSMEGSGGCLETVEDIRIEEMGSYSIIADVSLDNETINTLKYTKQIGNVKSMDVWVWISGLLAVVLIILFLRLLVWIRSKRLRDKISKEKNTIEKEKNEVEERYKEINKKTKVREKAINDYEQYDGLVNGLLKKYKEVNSRVLLKGLGVADLLDENKDYRTEYENAQALYVKSYNTAINKAIECDDIDYDKKDGNKVLKDKYRQLHSCLEEVCGLKQEAETKAEVLEALVKEVEEKYELLHETAYKIREMMDQDFNCGIEIKWPRQDQQYCVDISADEFDYGIAQLDALDAAPQKRDSRGKFTVVPFKEAIGDYETNIIILPYRWENGSDGIELQSDKDFGITDLTSNKPVKSCEPIDPNQPDGEKKYVARLEKGGQYSLRLPKNDGLGALTLILKDEDK